MSVRLRDERFGAADRIFLSTDRAALKYVLLDILRTRGHWALSYHVIEGQSANGGLCTWRADTYLLIELGDAWKGTPSWEGGPFHVLDVADGN